MPAILKIGAILLLVIGTCSTNDLLTASEELRERIYYANSHFSEGSKPGAQTDRGRVYIGLGPPDVLRDFKGPQYPYQSWMYRVIPGIGTDIMLQFVDEAMNGVYRIVPWSPVGDDEASVEDRRMYNQIQDRIRQTLERILKESKIN